MSLFLWSWAALLFVSSLIPSIVIDAYFAALVAFFLVGYLAFIPHVLNEKKLEKAHAETRLVLARYNEKIDNERLNISRLLHDSVNQKLIVSKLKLQQLKGNLKSPENITIIDQLIDLSSDMFKDCRRVIELTRVEMVESLGLIAAIQALIDSYKVLQSDIEYHFTYDEIVIDNKVSLTLYYIVNEAMLNIIRHSQASKVEVVIKKLLSKKYRLSISDNGIGIENTHKAGIGIIDMRERAQQLGSKLELTSSKEGTKIVINFSV